MCSLEIQNLDCLTENFQEVEAVKRECPKVNRRDITSSKFRGQKLAVVSADEQHGRKRLRSEKNQSWMCRMSGTNSGLRRTS